MAAMKSRREAVAITFTSKQLLPPSRSTDAGLDRGNEAFSMLMSALAPSSENTARAAPNRTIRDKAMSFVASAGPLLTRGPTSTSGREGMFIRGPFIDTRRDHRKTGRDSGLINTIVAGYLSSVTASLPRADDTFLEQAFDENNLFLILQLREYTMTNSV